MDPTPFCKLLVRDVETVCMHVFGLHLDDSRSFAKETFSQVDANVWSMLWQWAVRRHPNKGAKWVKEKYFKTRGTRNWVFTATEEKRMERNKSLPCCKSRTRQYSGMSRSKPTRIRTTQNGSSTSSPGGARKC
ncbi:group II intron maturase-specific domain-containing protein [Cupriavidus sp. CuC1]|uniref:group II intron maturase-specific domain-containing protein n=1 Tax=Cupriavidus sp. CuC1 TaxID=3373131 RepID=UPI0037CEF662